MNEVSHGWSIGAIPIAKAAAILAFIAAASGGVWMVIYAIHEDGGAVERAEWLAKDNNQLVWKQQQLDEANARSLPLMEHNAKLNDEVTNMLAEPDYGEPVSLYLSLCASFVHFIFVQFLALAFEILALSFDFYYAWPTDIRSFIDVFFAIFGAIGYLLFLYSLTSMLAATMTVFRTCYWYELHQKAVSGNNAVKGQ